MEEKDDLNNPAKRPKLPEKEQKISTKISQEVTKIPLPAKLSKEKQLIFKRMYSGLIINKEYTL